MGRYKEVYPRIMLIPSILVLIVWVSSATDYTYDEFTYPDECPGAKKNYKRLWTSSPADNYSKESSRERQMIADIEEYHDTNYFAKNAEEFVDKGNQSEYEIMYAISVGRKDPARANENPLKSYIKMCHEGVEKRGTGLDLSTIYYEDPLRVGRIVIKRGDEDVFEYHFNNSRVYPHISPFDGDFFQSV
ncbi:hypothetical protein RB195_007006 [Necator americanus]|uniref:Uncharacterized protein n=1 Tax=Necator americanus TaxID=51031 RepID=A0ABR1BY31_NECAM